MHELGHIALLHIPRVGNRNRLVWNFATDIVINNMLENEGYSFKGVENCWKDQAYGEKPAEEIYDELMANQIQPPPGGGSWGQIDPNAKVANGPGDIIPPLDPKQAQQAVTNVVQAAHAARISGQGGSIPGNVETVLKQFLAPVVPWEAALHRFFQDLSEHDFDWRSRDRRFADIYLPGEISDEGRLDHLIYYLDVSGSVTDAQVVRFNSEVKYIKDTFNPKKLTLVQFDTRITSEITFEENDPFDELVVIGRGGTMWAPVRAHIEQHKPTAAIVFSDMGFWDALTKPDHEIPMIWVAISNRGAQVPCGQLIHIKG
jgi:predicted metal-dependent peptidase